ncbi:PAS domain S-box protein [Spirochaeta cellobiosiphila]|uniref:PAS domain S-box protein n=1 Tax=Spirochaeta cellobiosiphila TaxID=504483 RepID=UPI0003F87996|nr:PAS domain S-box protein [Spirochaeta cellobiosiphila]
MLQKDSHDVIDNESLDSFINNLLLGVLNVVILIAIGILAVLISFLLIYYRIPLNYSTLGSLVVLFIIQLAILIIIKYKILPLNMAQLLSSGVSLIYLIILNMDTLWQHHLVTTHNMIFIALLCSFILIQHRWFFPSLMIVGGNWFYLIYEQAESGQFVELSSFAIFGLALAIVQHYVISSYIQRLWLKNRNKMSQIYEVEAALAIAEDSKRLLSRINDASTEGIAFHNGQIILDCNPQLASMYGYESKAQLMGVPIDSLAMPSSVKKIHDNIERTTQAVYEAMAQKKDGTEFPIQISARTISSEGEDFLRVAAIHDLTFIKQYQLQLEQSESNYKFLTDNSLDIVSRISKDKGFLYISPSYHKITGYEFQEYLGHDDIRKVLGLNWHVLDSLDSDGVKNVTHSIKAKNGDILWCESTISRIKSKESDDFRIVTRDISEKVIQEQNLQLQFDVAHLINLNLNIPAFIQKSLEVICLDMGWILGELWEPLSKDRIRLAAEWHLDTPRIQEFAQDSYNITFDIGEGLPGMVMEEQRPIIIPDVTSEVLFIRRKEARAANLRGAIGFPLYDKGELYSVLLFFSHDVIKENGSVYDIFFSVGGQIGQYLKRKYAEEEASKSEALFRTMSEFSPVGIFLTDPDGQCNYVNKRYQEISGLTEEEAMGDGWSSIIHPDDAQRVYEGWAESVKKKESYTGRHRIIYKDGQQRWVAANGAAFYSGDVIIGHVGVLQDITENVHQQEELLRYSEQLSDMVEERTKEIKVLQEEVFKQQIYQKEIKIASEVQMNLLPNKIPSIEGFGLGFIAVPAHFVSGDFYDVADFAPHTLCLTIADISGKGFPAALIAASARTILQCSTSAQSSPDRLLSTLQDQLFPDLSKAEKFITMQITLINTLTGEVSYSNAGHTETLLWRKLSNTIEILAPTTYPIGVMDDIGLNVESAMMRPGDTLLMYSDGVTEAENSKLGFYGIDRLKDSFQKLSQQDLSASELTDRLTKQIVDYIDSNDQSDDITIIAVKAENIIVKQSFPGVFNELDNIVLWSKSCCRRYSEEFAMQIELVMSELITNIIKYAIPSEEHKNIDIQIDLQEDGVIFQVSDYGISFDYDHRRNPDFNEPHEGGYGLWMMNELMDKVTYTVEKADHLNHWVLSKKVKSD